MGYGILERLGWSLAGFPRRPVPILNLTSRPADLWKGVSLFLMIVGLLVVPKSSGIAGVGSASTDYVLGPQDKVRVKAFEWRASLDAVYEWTAFNAEYIVGPGGKISLPLIGEIAAAGISPGELATAIGSSIRGRIGLGAAPDVNVEVVQFRPFYIVGDVEKPGEYAYRPGLTVLHAIAIAGGTSRNGLGQMRLEREFISTKGGLALLETEMMATLARRARLTAEREGYDKISFPKEVNRAPGNSAFAQVIHHEKLIFDSRKEAVATQIFALEQLRSLHEKEATSLTKQIAAHDKNVELLNEELQAVTHLYEKKLTTAPRKLTLERNAAQLLGDRIRLETALARANQEASKTEISILELRNKRQTEIADELQKSQLKIDEIKQRIGTSEDLMYETEVIAPRYASTRAQFSKNQPVLTIVRQSRGQSLEISASDATPLQPGDALKIEMPMPDPMRLEIARTVQEKSGSQAQGHTDGALPLVPGRKDPAEAHSY